MAESELIERLKTGIGPDRELDCAIFCIQNPTWAPHSAQLGIVHEPAGRGPIECNPYTASLDDALAFAEAMLPGWGYQVGRPLQAYGATGWYASVFRERKEGETGFLPGHFSHDIGETIDPPPASSWKDRFYASSPARALLLATLRALSIGEDEG